MSDRVNLDPDEVGALVLVGRVVSRFEYVPPAEGADEDSAYLVIDFAPTHRDEEGNEDGLTLYTSAPSFWRDLLREEMVGND